LLPGTLAAARNGTASGRFRRLLGQFGPLLGNDPISGSYAGVIGPLRKPCAFLGFTLQVGGSSHVFLTKISPIGSQPCDRNGRWE
jgi:hypothetical protein